VFISAAVVSIAAAVSAKFILAPMRKRWIENSGAPAGAVLAEVRLQPSSSTPSE
jgi:OFA family oxalate/formate antiporter-like MFS transporter